jgi:ferric-dicitrate binding protein FerR (iron transport regulator)
MDCEQVLDLISAQIDRELLPGQQALLDAHLEQCPECRSAADEFQAQDAALRRTFAPRRQAALAVAERVVAQLRTSPSPNRHRLAWLPMLAAAAAGFLAALLVFRPWQHVEVVIEKPDPFTMALGPTEMPQLGHAFLTVANEPVEISAANGSPWQKFESGGELALGCRVRTGPSVRCEFRTADGSEIRLNSGTELLFAASRRLELIKGQIMARVAEAGTPFKVIVPKATITALGTEFDLLCKPLETVLTVLQGSTKVEGQGADQIVRKGQAATIIDGQVARTDAIHDMVLATNWVHEILMLKGRDNNELARRVNDLFAHLGQAKIDTLYEEEIRGLGYHCVVPLTRYIQSDLSKDRHKRIRAASILADLAQPWSIPDLIQLLGDKDAEVRYYAAKGLKRLTAQTMRRELEDWRRLQPKDLQDTQKEWQFWWEQNKARFPGSSPARD